MEDSDVFGDLLAVLLSQQRFRSGVGNKGPA